MKLSFIVLLLVALFAFPALAQDDSTQTITYDGFGFTYPTALSSTLNIADIAGDPPDIEQPGGPQVGHRQFTLYYNQPPAPENIFDTSATIRVYRTADFAGYESFSQELQALQTLLADRPDLSPFVEATVASQENSLPFIPVFPSSQILRAYANYVDTGTVSGISYITLFRLDVAPVLGHELLYTFQGVSNDGSTYVSAVFWITTDLFPSELPEDFDYEAFSAGYEEHIAEAVATLNNASPDDFAPSLTMLDSIIGSFVASAPDGGEAAPTTEAPEVTPTQVLDPTLGGLADTWNLVSYGDPANPTPVLETAPISISFTPGGAGGSAGCNQFGGANFQYDANTITFGEIVTTRMACAEDVMAQETAFLEALASATTFEVGDGQLRIFYDGGVLNFESATTPPETPEATDPTLGGLAGTWNLVSYGDPNNPQQVVGATPPTLVLAPDSAGGNGGCNQFGADTFSFDGNTITFGQIVSTLMACMDEAVMAQESAYLAALQSASTYTLTDGQLQIAYDGGVLNFIRAQ